MTNKYGYSLGINKYDDITEYYLVYRMLKMKKAQIILRDTVIDAINTSLVHITKTLGIQNTYKILLNRIMTLNDVENYIEEYNKGDLSFTKVQNFLYGV